MAVMAFAFLLILALVSAPPRIPTRLPITLNGVAKGETEAWIRENDVLVPETFVRDIFGRNIRFPSLGLQSLAPSLTSAVLLPHFNVFLRPPLRDRFFPHHRRSLRKRQSRA